METTINKNKQKLEDKMPADMDRKIANSPKDIPGWGIDADPENEPTYPMKNYTGADHDRLNYERAPQQPINIEVLHSTERPGVTRVFGTSAPPSGWSGALRRYAFRFSEGNAAHWMTLILADRVNMIEGIIDDIKRGHIPNIFAERGWQAEWKYNRKATVKKIVIGVVIACAVIAARSKKRKKSWALSR
jgi:hypothetical protein